MIWQAPLERAAALLVSGLMVGLMILCVRRRVFEPQASIEVRADQARGDHVDVDVTADGKALDESARLELADGEPAVTARQDGDRRLADLRSATVRLPATPAAQLKVRVHRVTTEGDSEPLSATVDVRRAADGHRLVADRDGVASLRIDGTACEVRIAFPEATPSGG